MLVSQRTAMKFFFFFLYVCVCASERVCVYMYVRVYVYSEWTGGSACARVPHEKEEKKHLGSISSDFSSVAFCRSPRMN